MHSVGTVKVGIGCTEQHDAGLSIFKLTLRTEAKLLGKHEGGPWGALHMHSIGSAMITVKQPAEACMYKVQSARPNQNGDVCTTGHWTVVSIQQQPGR